MVKPTNALPPEPLNPPEQTVRTLAQEQLDFTAEGSPPPGQVAGTGATASMAGTAVKIAAEPKEPKAPKAHDHPVPPRGAAAGRRQPPAPAGPARRASKRNPAAWGGNR